jgi:tRNA (cytidine/uridine-2'-O-)-methyltransferase
LEVILFNPQIPQNAGNVVRTCAVTKTRLTLVRPLGFSTASRHLKRAGLDYWDEMEIEIVDSIEERLETASFYYFSSKVKPLYTDISFKEDDLLIFGSETSGLPSYFFEKWPEKGHTIPMVGGKRCLNLANSVAIVLYEGLRQQGFKGLKSGIDH